MATKPAQRGDEERPLATDAPALSTARLPAGGPSGVDRAQIEAMLDLAPIERIRVLEDWISGIEALRGLLGAGGDVGEVR